jgi:3-methyladenine DNA glycosylase AlkD
MARALKLPMVDREERFMAQVAWAYYVERLTQEAVAQKLGTTRLRVNKALGEALRRGSCGSPSTPPFRLAPSSRRRCASGGAWAGPMWLLCPNGRTICR